MSVPLSTVLRATAAQLSALRSIPTCDLSDALLKVAQPDGGQRVVGPHGGFLPDLRSFGQPSGFAGEAFTVQMVNASDTDAPTLNGHYIDLCPPERVMVVARPPGAELPISAFLGGLLATALAVKKVAGVVLDGRCRDLAELRALPLPVLAKAHGTIGQSPFTRVSAVEVPVAWAGTGLLINPYDVIVADEDGVVVVRPSTIDAVLEQVAKGQEADAKCLEDIKAGGTVADAFRKHRGKK